MREYSGIIINWEDGQPYYASDILLIVVICEHVCVLITVMYCFIPCNNYYYTEMVYNDPNAIEVYIFDHMTGQLTRIENLVDDSYITIHYNDKQQPVSFNHSNGDTMTITYTDSGLLNFADITDQEGNVKQSR